MEEAERESVLVERIHQIERDLRISEVGLAHLGVSES
jgi:hypothetical protein